MRAQGEVMSFRAPFSFALPLLALLGMGGSLSHPALAAPPAPTPWAFEASDLAPDPAFRFGRLANGMRYVIRANHTPAGTAMVRLDVATGSLDEGPATRGYAHFIEHMAFNGSTHVPEGEMVRLLERKGWPSARTPTPRPASSRPPTCSTCPAPTTSGSTPR
jgi:zinc protease